MFSYQSGPVSQPISELKCVFKQEQWLGSFWAAVSNASLSWILPMWSAECSCIGWQLVTQADFQAPPSTS